MHQGLCVLRLLRIADEPICRSLLREVDALHYAALPDLFRTTEEAEHDSICFRKSLKNPDQLMLGAELDRNLIGIAFAEHRSLLAKGVFQPRSYVLLKELVVARDFRRQGVARALIKKVHSWAAQRGAEGVELVVFAFNHTALATYAHMGYQIRTSTLWFPLQT